ncbi:MAG: hypothetical protein WC827_03595 [Candidatus Paceibacterota bacterium]|jgi:hypothetical protein
MTYLEIFEHPKFLSFYEQSLYRLQVNREKTELKPGVRFKNDPMGKLRKEGHMYHEWVLKEFDLILRKQSTEPAYVRAWIYYFVYYICEQTLIWIEKHKENESI